MSTLRLGDVCLKIGSGATPRGGSEVYLDHGVALIRSQNVHNDGFRFHGLVFLDDVHAAQLSSVEVRVGDVLLNITGDSVARACIAPAEVLPARVNQHVAIVRPNSDELDPRYLHYYLVSPKKQQQMLALASAGATRNALTKGMIEAFEVPAPPIDDQRRIAGVLGSLDDKIEQNRRTSVALERLAQTIFQAWFVDFEPVKAKAAGATDFPSMPQGIFDALPDTLVESEIGQIPKGWGVKPIGDVVTVKGGATPSTKVSDYWEGGTHCWATPKDLSRLSDLVLLDTERRITDTGVAQISSGLLPVDTVLLSSRAPVGYLALAGVPTAINQGFIAMVCDGPLPPVYVLNWAYHAMGEIKGRASGTTFAEISKAGFRPIPVVVPTPAVVQSFRELAEPLFHLLTATVKETGRLQRMRDYLLPRLLSGEVRVEVRHG